MPLVRGLSVLVLLLGGAGSGRPAAAADEIRVATTPGLVYQVVAGERYAAWGLVVTRPTPPTELARPGRPPPEQMGSTLFAAELGAAPPQVITVAETLPVGTPFNLVGTRLTWAAPAPAGGRYVLHGYDLATGQPLAMPGDAAGPGAPVLSGPWIVWGGPRPDGTPAIQAVRLDTGERRTLASYVDAAGGLAAPPPLAGDATRVAYVATSPAGTAPLHLYTFAGAQDTLLHTFGPGDPPPARGVLSGRDLFYEQPAANAPGVVTVVRWNLDTGPRVLATARAGSLAVGSGLVAWQPLDTPRQLVALDLAVDRPLDVPLLPAPAVPAGPAALSATWVVWADRRDERAGGIYAARLAARAVPGAALSALWQAADGPVAAGQAARGWLWGPAPAGFAERYEPYTTATSTAHRVRYYDKGTMELNDPAADPAGPWYVTSGLLVVQLISGCIRYAPALCWARDPPAWPVAGDADSPAAPTYAALARVTWLAGLPRAPDRRGALITATLDRAGQAAEGAVPDSAQRIGAYEPASGHNVAAVFAEYLQRAAGGAGGPRVFDPLLVVGYPIAEPYWMRIRAGGQERQVLMQAFERRVLTYSPANPAGWQVEMGNVGRHYYDWRGTVGLLGAPLLH